MKPKFRSQSSLFSAAACLALCSPLAHAGTVSTTFSFQQGDLQKDGAAYGSGATYAGAVDGRVTDDTATSARSTTATATLGNQFRTGSPNGQQHCGLFSYDLTELNNFIAANTTPTSAVTVNSVSFTLISSSASSGTAMTLGLYGTDPFTSTDCTWSNYTTGTAWTVPYQSLLAPNDTVTYGWTGGPSALTPSLGGANPNTGTSAPIGTTLAWTSSAYFIDTLSNALDRPDKTLHLTARGTFFSNSDNRVNVNTSSATTVDNRPELVVNLSVSDASDWTGASSASWATAGNWTNAPATGNQVRFNSLSTANLNTTLNADFNLNGISLINPTGPVSIGGTNSLTLGAGGLDLSAATQNLTVTAPMVLGGAQIWNVASGRTLSVSGTVTGSGDLTIFGAGKTSLGANNILPNGAGAGNLNVSGTLDLNGTSQSVNGLSGAGTIDNPAAGTTTLNIGNNNATSTFSGTIQNTGGAVAVVKQGTGSLTLSGTNSFSGGTTINAGAIVITNNANLGASTGGITFNAAGGESSLFVNASVTDSNRTVTLASSATGNIRMNAANPFTNAGKFTGAGNLRFSQTGSGFCTATLAALNNDFSGSLTIDQNGSNNSIRVIVNSLTDPVGAGNIISKSVGTNAFPAFRLGADATSGLTLTNRRIELAGPMGSGSFFTLSNESATHALTINSNLLVSGTAGTRRLSLAGVAGPVNVFDGDIADEVGSVVSVTKTGGSTWTLSGNNSHTGGTNLNGGTAGSQLNIKSATALGTGTFSISGGNNGKIDNTSGLALTLSTNNAQAWDSNFTFVGTDALNLGTGAVTLGGNRSISMTASTLTVGGNIGESAAGFGLTKSGWGTLVLTGTSTYTGNTAITTGKLDINSIQDFGVSSAIGAPPLGIHIQLGSGTGNFATLSYSGAGGSTNRTVQVGDATPANDSVGAIQNNGSGALTFTATPNFNPTITGITATRTVWLGGSYSGGANEIQGIIQDNDTVAGGKVNVGKAAGDSIWLLSGANTYTGSTIVQAGGALKLGATASIASSTALSISAGGTLDTSDQATYTIPGTQPVAFGIDATGSGSSGKISAAALNVSNAVVTYNYTPGTLDDPVYVLATYTGTLGGTFASVDPAPAGYTLNYAYEGNKIALVQSAVSGFAAWQAANSTAGGLDADHDGDGVDNGTEYFLFGNANSTGFTPLPGVTNTGGTLSVTWTKAATGYAGTYGSGFVVETSDTLVGAWTTEKADPEAGFTVTFPTATEVKYTFPAGAVRKFARLKVTGP